MGGTTTEAQTSHSHNALYERTGFDSEATLNVIAREVADARYEHLLREPFNTVEYTRRGNEFFNEQYKISLDNLIDPPAHLRTKEYIPMPPQAAADLKEALRLLQSGEMTRVVVESAAADFAKEGSTKGVLYDMQIVNRVLKVRCIDVSAEPGAMRAMRQLLFGEATAEYRSQGRAAGGIFGTSKTDEVTRGEAVNAALRVGDRDLANLYTAPFGQKISIAEQRHKLFLEVRKELAQKFAEGRADPTRSRHDAIQLAFNHARSEINKVHQAIAARYQAYTAHRQHNTEKSTPNFRRVTPTAAFSGARPVSFTPHGQNGRSSRNNIERTHNRPQPSPQLPRSRNTASSNSRQSPEIRDSSFHPKLPPQYKANLPRGATGAVGGAQQTRPSYERARDSRAPLYISEKNSPRTLTVEQQKAHSLMPQPVRTQSPGSNNPTIIDRVRYRADALYRFLKNTEERILPRVTRGAPVQSMKSRSTAVYSRRVFLHSPKHRSNPTKDVSSSRSKPPREFQKTRKNAAATSREHAPLKKTLSFRAAPRAHDDVKGGVRYRVRQLKMRVQTKTKSPAQPRAARSKSDTRVFSAKLRSVQSPNSKRPLRKYLSDLGALISTSRQAERNKILSFRLKREVLHQIGNNLKSLPLSVSKRGFIFSLSSQLVHGLKPRSVQRTFVKLRSALLMLKNPAEKQNAALRPSILSKAELRLLRSILKSYLPLTKTPHVHEQKTELLSRVAQQILLRLTLRELSDRSKETRSTPLLPVQNVNQTRRRAQSSNTDSEESQERLIFMLMQLRGMGLFDEMLDEEESISLFQASVKSSEAVSKTPSKRKSIKNIKIAALKKRFVFQQKKRWLIKRKTRPITDTHEELLLHELEPLS